MRKLILIFIVSISGLAAEAQTAEDSVKAVIINLFEGMKQVDTARLKNVFAENCTMQTISKNKMGETLVITDSLSKFIEGISKLPVGAADEQIKFAQLKIDGPLASVWTPYKFFYNGKFSHCGVNSFQLVKLNNEWKIQYLIDTRRRTGCE